MATNKLQWKRIAKGEILPCQSFLRKKDGEILKLSTIGGVTVGQDCYYLPVDEVINVIKDYPVEESEDEKIRKTLVKFFTDWGKTKSHCWSVHVSKILAWLKKQGEHAKFRDSIQVGDNVTRNKDCVLVNLSQLNRVAKKDEKQGEKKPILDIEIPFGAKDSELEEVSYYIPKGYHAEIEDNKVVIKKGKQKPAWSEEDENILATIIEEGDLKPSERQWLRTIKYKYTWKPSSEQIKVLEFFIPYVTECSVVLQKSKDTLSSLLSDLKKLREE